MKKRTYLMIALLSVIFVGILGCVFIFIRTTPELKDSDIEEMRDSLKVYQPITEEQPVETTPPETEVDVPIEMELTETETVSTEEPLEREETLPAEPETVSLETQPVETIPTETEVIETKAHEKAESTLDFEPMWDVNPDIYAWIEIEGTKVDYPILQNAEDDDKYLNTAQDGSTYIGGAIFTQASYNAKDFNDPVTVIYGHTMRSGTLFGQLQSVYSSAASFSEHSEITIYLPDEVRHYTVFAAVPYENLHILHTYDFSVKYWYNNFFKNVSTIRSIGANFNREITPEYGDRVIILSTCLNEDSTKRFLVMAILQDDIE